MSQKVALCCLALKPPRCWRVLPANFFGLPHRCASKGPRQGRISRLFAGLRLWHYLKSDGEIRQLGASYRTRRDQSVRSPEASVVAGPTSTYKQDTSRCSKCRFLCWHKFGRFHHACWGTTCSKQGGLRLEKCRLLYLQYVRLTIRALQTPERAASESDHSCTAKTEPFFRDHWSGNSTAMVHSRVEDNAPWKGSTSLPSEG